MSAQRRLAAPLEPSHEGDAALLALVARGDLGALGELYDRHRKAVHAFLARATSDRDAEDLLHDAFLMAARVAGRFDGRASCRPWLIGIAARLVLQRRRGVGRIVRVLSRLALVAQPSHDPAPALEARDTLWRVAFAISRMSEAKRLVVLMAETEGMSGPEIAQALGIPLGTVWTRLHAARAELRAAVPEWGSP
jgi:RNA polymerase sigma-70 factor (ECF subfamily)